MVLETIIGEHARIGIGSVLIGPVILKINGLGQACVCFGFNHIF